MSNSVEAEWGQSTDGFKRSAKEPGPCAGHGEALQVSELRNDQSELYRVTFQDPTVVQVPSANSSGLGWGRRGYSSTFSLYKLLFILQDLIQEAPPLPSLP